MGGAMNNEVGKAHYKSGNFTMAKDEFQRAVINDPQNADYIHNLAAAHKKQGKIGEAEKLYRQAIVVNPEHQPSYHSLALLLNEQNRSSEAVQLMQTWKDTQPYNSSAYVELAWMKREMGDLPEAERLLQQALRIRPSDATATAHLGQIYEDMGQKDRALAMYQRSRFSRWNQPQVASRMAAITRENPGVSPTASAVYAPTPWNNTAGTGAGGYPQHVVNYPLPGYGAATSATVIGQPPIGPPPVQVGSPIVPVPDQIGNIEPAVKAY